MVSSGIKQDGPSPQMEEQQEDSSNPSDQQQHEKYITLTSKPPFANGHSASTSSQPAAYTSQGQGQIQGASSHSQPLSSSQINSRRKQYGKQLSHSGRVPQSKSKADGMSS